MEEKKQHLEKSEEPNETLEKHTLHSWLKNSALGFFIGLAVIVPGISGATISIIFKLYNKLLYAVSTIFKQFKKSFFWLLPIGVGLIIGFIGGFFGVQKALDYIPFAIVCLFAGLMAGSFHIIQEEIKGQKITPLRAILFILGFILPIALSVLISLTMKDDASIFQTVHWYEYLLFLVFGFAIAFTQVVPGLSASAFLMMVGYYQPLMDAITFQKSTNPTIMNTPSIIVLLVLMIVGFLIGFWVVSKIMHTLFKKAKVTTYFPIVGLSLASIVTMFFNPEIYTIYRIWANQLTMGSDKHYVSYGLDISLGIALLIIGIMISASLIIYQKKHEAKKQLTNK